MDVFMEWALLWARRAIIKLVKPVPGELKSHSLPRIEWHSRSINTNFIGAIFELGAFERFVFIVSLLERQSDEDCSALLSCRRRDIQLARVQALKSLPHTDRGCNPFKEALQAWEIIRARQSTGTGAMSVRLVSQQDTSNAGAKGCDGVSDKPVHRNRHSTSSISNIAKNRAAIPIRKESSL
jgi:hypothetical protein